MSLAQASPQQSVGALHGSPRARQVLMLDAQTPELLSQMPVQQSAVCVQKSPGGMQFVALDPIALPVPPVALVRRSAPVQV